MLSFESISFITCISMFLISLTDNDIFIRVELLFDLPCVCVWGGGGYYYTPAMPLWIKRECKSNLKLPWWTFGNTTSTRERYRLTDFIWIIYYHVIISYNNAYNWYLTYSWKNRMIYFFTKLWWVIQETSCSMTPRDQLELKSTGHTLCSHDLGTL